VHKYLRFECCIRLFEFCRFAIIQQKLPVRATNAQDSQAKTSFLFCSSASQVAGDLRVEGGMVSRDDESGIVTLRMQPPFLRGEDRVVF
jgi:hypothetical protein